jgi:hypothetical protein
MMDNQSDEMKDLVKKTVHKALADQSTKAGDEKSNDATEKFYQQKL